jgi:hypothetical protein
LREAHYLPLGLLVTLLSLLAEGWLSRPPAVVPESAPAEVFSGAGGMALLELLLRENVPYPAGSAENRRVKARIRAWLDEHGIHNEEQHAWGCRENGNTVALPKTLSVCCLAKRRAPM